MALSSPLFLPLRVGGSSACRRVRRDSAPAGVSLSFVASNESNQSKDALHLAVPLRLLPSATCHLGTDTDHGTPVRGTPPLGSLRIAKTKADVKRGVDGDVCAANDRIALGPRGWRRGAQGFGAARVSALRQLTSRRLSERSGPKRQRNDAQRAEWWGTLNRCAVVRVCPQATSRGRKQPKRYSKVESVFALVTFI